MNHPFSYQYFLFYACLIRKTSRMEQSRPGSGIYSLDPLEPWDIVSPTLSTPELVTGEDGTNGLERLRHALTI